MKLKALNPLIHARQIVPAGETFVVENEATAQGMIKEGLAKPEVEEEKTKDDGQPSGPADENKETKKGAKK